METRQSVAHGDKTKCRPWRDVTRAQTLHASRSLTVRLRLHLPAEPGVGQLPSLIFAGGGGEGSGEEPHSEVEKGEGALKRTSVKLVNSLASFSRRKTVPHGQMGNCRCSWLGLFRVFWMRRIRWSICNGSEHTAFPEIGIRNALACASCTHMCWWACTFPKCAWSYAW